jgi:hypothetical protein
MNKKTKMLLAVAVIGVAGYYYWKSKQPKGNYSGLMSVGDRKQTGSFSGSVGNVTK